MGGCWDLGREGPGHGDLGLPGENQPPHFTHAGTRRQHKPWGAGTAHRSLPRLSRGRGCLWRLSVASGHVPAFVPPGSQRLLLRAPGAPGVGAPAQPGRGRGTRSLHGGPEPHHTLTVSRTPAKDNRPRANAALLHGERAAALELEQSSSLRAWLPRAAPRTWRGSRVSGGQRPTPKHPHRT